MEQTLTSADTVAALRERILASGASWAEDALPTLRELQEIARRFKGWPAKVPALVNHCQLLKLEHMTGDQAVVELGQLRAMVETPEGVQAKIESEAWRKVDTRAGLDGKPTDDNPEQPEQPEVTPRALGDKGMIALADAFNADRSDHLCFLGSKFVLDIIESPVPGEYLVTLKGAPKAESLDGNTTLFYKRKEAPADQAADSAATAEKMSTVVDTPVAPVTPAPRISLAPAMLSVEAAHKLCLSDQADFKGRGLYCAQGTLVSIERLVGPGSGYLLHFEDGGRLLAKGEEMVMQKSEETAQAATGGQEVASAATNAAVAATEPAAPTAPTVQEVQVTDGEGVPLTLTAAEHDDLRLLERRIEGGLRTFVDVGNALAEIKERKLYRLGHKTFDDYVRERWQMGKSRAYQLISAATTAKNLSTVVDIPAPENERQMRPLSQLAPERRAEAWQKAAERAGEETVTETHVQAVVDEMLGKVGRFENEMHYPVDDKGRRVFNAPNEDYSELSGDERFEGCEVIEGAELNDGRKYDAYSLVAVPDVHPQDRATVLPSLTDGNMSRLIYPIDRAAKAIYDAPCFSRAFKPEVTYKDCTWIAAYELDSHWSSVADCLGEYEIRPAREISIDWLKTAAFQPGMAATCPECAKNKYIGVSIFAFEKWQPIEEGFFGCPNSHRVKVEDLTFGDLPAQPTTQSGNGRGAEESEEDRQARQLAWKLENVLGAVRQLDHLLAALRNEPDLARQALDPEILKKYRAHAWADGKPSEDAVAVVSAWLDGKPALPDLTKPVAAQDTEDDDDIDEDEDLDENESTDQDFDETEEGDSDLED